MQYKRLANNLQRQIQQGQLTAGDKLPALRSLAQQHQVSMTTAVNCYQWLEAGGWIQAVPQSGFYVKGAPQTSNPPAPLPFTAVAVKANRAVEIPGLPLGPLGISRLAPELLPTQALQRAMKRALQRLGNGLHDYPPRAGAAALREALAQHLRHYQLYPEADDLHITHGCLDAVRQALEVCTRPGDTVAISSPCFNGLLELLASLDRQVLEIPGTREGVDLIQLEQHLAAGDVQACLLSSSHLNPQGICLSVNQKQQLATMAARYQIPMIEDDIYLELDTRPDAAIPAKHFDRDGWILWCGSVSKSLGASLRLGWCWPGRFAPQWRERQSHQHYGVNLHAQLALADLINTGDYSRHLNRLKPTLASQLRQYRQVISQHLPQARISDPTGGCVLWVQVPGLDSQLLAERAYAQHIDLRPGELFSSRGFYRDCFRINAGFPLVDNDGKETDAARQLRTVLALV
ncbi:PLP-dependent aminotransferase family protein [Simiduia agarivorans]|uniref:Aminotransferase n=1 Tax=Simiduia agarivorans (strain DSM 21679 / JCM 13881 / BCRC 17597 / SA1) TaxID=1117647 RepID=K4KEC5_SIMAS|nr:PLP-dependent aminotransferase family protein [Simiduia agarivorans]AFU97261.1 aminotransferase [Simiduia agarivorans SA1 = DSM 21679]